MKLRRLVIILALLLAVPGINPANAEIAEKIKQGENKDKECDCEQQEHMHKDWQAKMKEREKTLLTWVDQYTPDKKAEWTKVIEEKKTLRNKWLSPEFAEKREKWKQEKMAKIQDIKKQFEEGKITKEEFVKKAHGGKDLGHFKTYHELKNAIAAKDEKEATALLNQLLEQAKQHNEKMKEMLNK